MSLLDVTGIGSILDLGGKIIDKIWPDPAQASAAKLELLKAQQAGQFKEMDAELQMALAQVGVNAVEAANASTFVSGWRPFIGWVCGFAFAYKFVVAPAAQFIMLSMGHSVALPVLDYAEMSSVLMGMLGLGALRTVEKVKGVATN